MKKLLLTMACVAAVSPLFAETVTFDFTAPDKLTPAVTLPADGKGTNLVDKETGVATTFTNGAIQITFNNGENTNNMPLIWNSKGNYTLRFYKGESVIVSSTGANITGINIVCNTTSSTGEGTVTASPASTGATTLGWIGDSKSVTFSQADNGKTVQVKSIEVTYGEAAEDPNANIILDEPFKSSLGDFVADNVTMPEDLTYVWNLDSYGYAKASAYKGQAFATESILVSPVLDLTNRENIELAFSSAVNKGTVAGLSVVTREEGATAWTALETAALGTGSSWAFNDITVSLEKFAGKKIQFGFRYTSTESDCATWEVKNVKVTGDKKSDGIADVNVDENAPVEFYNLQGVRVAEPENGIYIRRQGNSVSKVYVK
ncbi:MAG: choice-of-anchor J domain-containing protein [Bacteroidales bacterium]|nr:choice-of-anchor J domain-containing protein [Bacteroidales bacterium]